MQFLHKLQELLNPAFPKKRIENGLNHFPPPFTGQARKMPRQGQECWRIAQGLWQTTGETLMEKILPGQDSGLTRTVYAAIARTRAPAHLLSCGRCQLGPESIFFTPWLTFSSLV